MPGITLKKLSELSGLSIRTVNRVLKDQGEVTAANRELVKALAKKYNYLPNIAARNFRLQKKNVIGILMQDRLLNEAHLQKVADLERNLISEGYFPLLGCTADRDPRELLQEWNGMTDFVISFYFPTDKAEQAYLSRFPFRFILIDRPVDPRHHGVIFDRSIGINEAYDCMIERGCRRIVHCGSMGGRATAVAEYTKRLEGKAEFIRIITDDREFESGYRSGDAIVASKADAVFFDTDRMADGFYRYAWEKRIRIPDDISVVGFDDDSSSVMMAPPLSSVAHPISEISRTVMEIIRENPEKSVHRQLATRFIRRESLI